MKSSPNLDGLNRRDFLSHGAKGAVLGATASWVVSSSLQGADGGRNPFAYDVRKYQKTDPSLLGYERVLRLKSPRAEPRRLAIGPDDHIYLAAGSTITVLGSDGVPLKEIATGGAVRSLAIAPDGTIYAGSQDHVEVYDPAGKRRAAWTPVSGKPYLTGIAVGPEHVFVADAGNRVVWRHSLSGEIEVKIGEKNRDRDIPGLILPSPFLDVELGEDGLLRVNNPGRHRVELYTLDGRLELAWGKPSMAIQGFCGCCNPVNLALLDDGRVVTFEKGLPRVKVYSPHGDFECVVAGPEDFADTASADAIGSPDERVYGGLDGAVDSQGRVVILDLLGALIHIMRPLKAQAEVHPHGPNRRTEA